MRRALPLTAVALAVALALGGCGSSEESGEPTASASSGASVEVGTDGPFPTATGDFGEKPELTFPSAEPSDSLQVSVLSPGDGATVESGDLLVVNYLGQVWGGDVFDTSYDRGEPSAFPIGTGAVITGWDAALVGQTVGSRLLVTIPPDLGYGDQGNADAGIAGTDTLVFVVDIVDAYAPDVAGQADAAPTDEAAAVAPVVEGELGSSFTITVPAGAAEPTESSVAVLARGTGAPITVGTVIVQYAWTAWDGSEGQSTWEVGAPTTLQIGGGGPFDALEGVPLGSRVLVLIPASTDSPALAVALDLVDQLPTSP